MSHPVNDHALDAIFRKARSFNAWKEKDVPETLVRAVYELQKWGPTSANCSPARFLFIRTEAAKARLLPHLIGPNKEKSQTAPWVVIIAHDMEFHERIPELFPHNPGAKDWFEAPQARQDTAFRNGTLQSAYFLVAARALGLDTGPMSGFDNAGVDREFFESQDGEMKHWKSNWICNLGYGSTEGLFERSPRMTFDEACKIL
ncbi:MAG: malonic semialdehyde reductase [Pseudomonadota bacterium]